VLSQYRNATDRRTETDCYINIAHDKISNYRNK